MSNQSNTYPCSICRKNVVNDAILCDICNCWVHRTCAKLSKKQLQLKSNSNYYYFCRKRKCELPFMDLNDDDFLYCNSSFELDENVFQVYSKCQNIDYFENECMANDRDEVGDMIGNFQMNCKYYFAQQNAININNIDGLSVIHFNARSLSANFVNIKECLSQIKNHFHVIAISESWLDGNDNLDEFHLENYTMFNTIRNDKKGGGVALYVTNEIKVKKLEKLSCVTENLSECITVEIVVEKGKNIVVSCVYRTPGSDIYQFIEYLDNMLYEIKNNKSIYLIGDMNY